MLIFFIGIVSGASAGYAVYGSLGSNLLASFIVGAVWASIIITLDSLIITSIKDDVSLGAKLLKSIPRIVLSVFIGIVIARPAELKIFEKEIKNKLVDLRFNECKEREAKDTQGKVDENKSLSGDINKVEQNLSAVNEELACLYQLLTNERNGIASNLKCGSSSGMLGNGIRYQDLMKRIERLEKKQDQLMRELSIAQESKRANLSIINDKKSNINCSIIDIRKQIDNTDLSLLEANAALHRLIVDNTNGMARVIIFVTILIVCVELLPVINKIFLQAPSTSYNEKLEEFQRDAKTMNYLDLLNKYPHMPHKKQYQKNYENNRKIYEKLLSEYYVISKLNSEVQNKFDIMVDRHDIQRQTEREVTQEIAQNIKDSQLQIIDEIISIWKNQTITDIRSNPYKYMNLPDQNQNNAQNINSNTQNSNTLNHNNNNSNTIT